ncbi:hypothetical protein [Aporhodopirellula aestuarii]|uniref:Uncharacterized protein n=1 Tax=Aporhodopirellula aestuarii TaxID=2950107 RepID=A0ABT0U3R2_9BACT|nr:hypothetical protein [Aporhodopirellula aestuarii]MCM2371493.1 hypothetical protein [Aporhodopirellula aestuarii]
MGIVILRGALHGQLAVEVAQEAIATLIIFLGIGAITGAIADYLVRDAVENLYRNRVQWYRDEVAKREAGAGITTNEPTP